MANRLNARPLIWLAAGLALSGCMNFSALDDLNTATVPNTAFSLALYKNYAFLARSFGDVGQASYVAFDQEGSIPLTRTDANVAGLANSYARKALALSRGEFVDPEPSRDVRTHEQRERLVRALATGRDGFPRDAARAQADWDCWRLNSRVAGQAAAAEQCRRSFEVTLPRLEAETKALEAATAKDAPKPDAEKPAGTATQDETP